jgi:hypothetical protein
MLFVDHHRHLIIDWSDLIALQATFYSFLQRATVLGNANMVATLLMAGVPVNTRVQIANIACNFRIVVILVAFMCWISLSRHSNL